MMMTRPLVTGAVACVAACSISCASAGALGTLAARIITPPRFEQAADRRPEVSLTGPGVDRGFGGATVRIWTHVTNPNPFGIRLRMLDADLYLDAAHAAVAGFPEGLQLGANDDSILPIDLRIDYRDVPALGALGRAVRGDRVEYRLDGTITIDAGPLGQPSFGPTTWLRGDLGGRSVRD
jgi:hypothetical protein